MQNIQCADCGCCPEDCKDSISPQTCPNCSWKNAVAGIIYINGRKIISIESITSGNLGRFATCDGNAE